MMKEIDITKKKFKKSIRGYNVDDVDVFLEATATTVSQLTNENHMLKEKLRQLESKTSGYLNMENNLKEALVLAQKTSSETIATAKKTEEVMRKDAELAALKIVREAKEEAFKIEQKTESAKQDYAQFVEELERLYEKELDHLRKKIKFQ